MNKAISRTVTATGSDAVQQHPNELTHSLVMVLVGNDGSTREITMRYCSSDRWHQSTGHIENARTILKYMLPILARDRNTKGISVEVRDLKTLETVHVFGLIGPNGLRIEQGTGKGDRSQSQQIN